MVKRQTLGITQEVIWERLGSSPTQISRMKAMQTAGGLLAAAKAPTALSGQPSSTGNVPAQPVPA